MAASESYHEPLDLLSKKTRDLHRALVSLQEELEAVDWYQQRADAAGSEELRAVLIHNMNEEIEHACMVLEWLRRNHGHFDQMLRTYLFTSQPITEIEEEETESPQPTVEGPDKGASRSIGSLKKGE